MAKQKKFRVPLNAEGTIFLRVEFSIERGQVLRFVVQLEIELSIGDMRPGRRYDCAHGFAHRDRLNLRGETIKEKIDLDYEQALRYAQEDLKKNWTIYCECFRRGEYG